MKTRARYLLQRDLVRVIATDMLNLEVLFLKQKTAYEIIAKKYGAKKAKELFVENPRKIIMDQLI